MGELITIHKLVTEGYDPPYSYPKIIGSFYPHLPGPEPKTSTRHTLFDTASVELKKVLNDAEAHVKKMKPWQRSVPWNG